MKIGIFCLLFLQLLFSSCSSMRSSALGMATPMFTDALPALEKEGDWELFRDSTLSNLKLVEGLLATRPQDKNLMVSLIQGYAGYAFAIYETNYLADKLADKDKSIWKQRALSLYTKSFRFGLKFFEDEGIAFKDLSQSLQSENGLKELLDAKLSDDLTTLNGVAFFAQSLASMINMQRDKMSLLPMLPVAKGLFDWVCKIKPDLANGLCPIFYASYEAGRPRMLGGNPDKGKALFEKAIIEYPNNWMVRVAYLESYIIPAMDEDLYKVQKSFLNKMSKLHYRQLTRLPDEKENEVFKNKRLRIYQAIAIKRFEKIKKLEFEIF